MKLGSKSGFSVGFLHLPLAMVMSDNGCVRQVAVVSVFRPNGYHLIVSYGFCLSFLNVSKLSFVSYAGLQTKSPYYCNFPC